MGKLRIQAFGCTQIHLKMWKKSIRVYFVLLASAMLSFIYARNFSARVSAGDIYNVFEICTFIISGYALYGAMLYVLLINDSPFEGDMSDMILLRMGRIRALIAEEVYLLFSGVLFMLTWKIFAVLGMLDKAYFGAEWSESLLKMLNLRTLPEISPVTVLILDFINGTLYLWLLGNISLMGNMIFKKRQGHLLGVYAHGLFWAMKLDGIWGRASMMSISGPSLSLNNSIINAFIKLALCLFIALVTYAGGSGRCNGVEQ